MVQGADEKVVKEAIKRFENALTGTGRIMTPKCDEINNQELKKQTKDAVSQLLIKAYETLFNCVMDPKNAYMNPGTFFKHSPQLIKDTIIV